MIDRLKFWLAFLREPQRWSMAGLAIVFGTVALILADGFIEQIFVQFRESIIHSNLGHFQIVPMDDGRSAGRTLSPALRPEIEGALGEWPDTVVAAKLSFVGLASHGERTISFIGEGVEPQRERTLASQLVIDRGQALADDGGPALLLGEGLAKNLGVGVGDTVALLVTTPAGSVNAIEAPVAGIFHTSTKAYDDRALRLPLPAAQALLREDDVSRYVGVLPRTSDTADAVAALRKALEPPSPAADGGVQVRAWYDLADFYNKTVKLFSSQLAIVRAVIVAIVLLSVSNTLARNVMERTSEIGTMMALGRTRAAVARLFVGEGLLLGLACGIVGVLAGWMLALVISRVGIPMPPPPGMAHGFIARIAFTPAIGALALALAVVTSVVASLLPALRASRLNIVDALRVGR